MFGRPIGYGFLRWKMFCPSWLHYFFGQRAALFFLGETEMAKVAFIGLGVMSYPMA